MARHGDRQGGGRRDERKERAPARTDEREPAREAFPEGQGSAKLGDMPIEERERERWLDRSRS